MSFKSVVASCAEYAHSIGSDEKFDSDWVECVRYASEYMCERHLESMIRSFNVEQIRTLYNEVLKPSLDRKAIVFFGDQLSESDKIDKNAKELCNLMDHYNAVLATITPDVLICEKTNSRPAGSSPDVYAMRGGYFEDEDDCYEVSWIRESRCSDNYNLNKMRKNGSMCHGLCEFEKPEPGTLFGEEPSDEAANGAGCSRDPEARDELVVSQDTREIDRQDKIVKREIKVKIVSSDPNSKSPAWSEEVFQEIITMIKEPEYYDSSRVGITVRASSLEGGMASLGTRHISKLEHETVGDLFKYVFLNNDHVALTNVFLVTVTYYFRKGYKFLKFKDQPVA